MRLADCHPQRKHYARGFCRQCYEVDLKRRNPEYATKQKDNKSKWNRLHPEQRTKYNAHRKLRGRNLEVSFNQRLKKQYGISADNYNQMLHAQNGGCALCYRKPGKTRLHVDHDHETNIVRGLLCHQCNWYLGTIDADPTIIDRIIAHRAKGRLSKTESGIARPPCTGGDSPSPELWG